MITRIQIGPANNQRSEPVRLAPARPPIRIQRWSVRRIVLTLGVALAAFASVAMVVGNWAVFA